MNDFIRSVGFCSVMASIIHMRHANDVLDNNIVTSTVTCFVLVGPTVFGSVLNLHTSVAFLNDVEEGIRHYYYCS